MREWYVACSPLQKNRRWPTRPDYTTSGQKPKLNPGAQVFDAARIKANLGSVQDRIAAAAHRAGRQPSDVKLVAATKYVDAAVARALVVVGCQDLGESRPQELWDKVESLAANDNPINWHMIGHLQRNKVARTVPLTSLIHSGDSLRVLQAIDEAAESSGRRAAVLLEINISGDATKHGFAPDEIEPALNEIASFKSLDICGLMAMASREGNLDQARAEFAAIRSLRDRLLSVATPNMLLHELSMGMSGDFEVAVEEGATIVRVGSALFEGAIDE
jgi:PLP dependent protein